MSENVLMPAVLTTITSLPLIMMMMEDEYGDEECTGGGAG